MEGPMSKKTKEQPKRNCHEIPVTSNGNWYMEDFLEFFGWLSMDHSRNNYLIFKPNYFILFYF
jgi:hypothetical protein